MKLALTPFVEQLRAAGCNHAEGLLEFSRQTVAPRVLPARFVVPVSESPASGAAPTVGARDQAVDVALSVFLVLNGAALDRSGVSEQLQVETQRIVDALVGWTHPGASRACDYAGGRLASADGSTVVWELRFRTRYHLRRTS